MATYYVRTNGNDGNAGTSAGAAWLTIGKALGASGIASGDTVYIGAGYYRGNATVNMTSATAETRLIGDVDGVQTGDAGEVILTSFSSGEWSTIGSSGPIQLNGRDFLTFEKITFVGANTNFGSAILGTTTNSTDITVRDCAFISGRLSGGDAAYLTYTAIFGVAANWLVERCRFLGMGRPAIEVTAPTGVGSDYDLNVVVKNCLFVGSFGTGAAVSVSTTGIAANEGGGIDVHNCTFIGSGGLATVGTRISLTVPCTIQNCLILAGANVGINAGEAGAIIDNGYNMIHGNGASTNVTLHGTTRTDTIPAKMISLGQEYLWGGFPRPMFSPTAGSPLANFGNAGSAPTVDLLNRSRPAGGAVWGDAGTATAGGVGSLTDGGKTWKTNQWIGWFVRTTGGTGSGQVKAIASNTGTVLTTSGDGNWATTPDNTSTYIIYQGPQVTTGKATAGGASTLTNSNATWNTNQWSGYTIETTGGTGSGQTATVASNTGTVITRSGTWGTNPDSTTTYSLYLPGGSLTATQPATGALERQDTAKKETTTTDAGSVGIVINGPGSHDFLIPVNAASTTISVKAQYDTAHGTGSKPQAILLASGEIGVSTETKTMTSGAGSWDTLTFTPFTPSAKGIVTVRLVSRAAAPYGRAYFDTFGVA